MKTAAGMMATLVALIIGFWSASAKSTYDQTNASITQGVAKIITLDHLLAHYGPVPKPDIFRSRSSRWRKNGCMVWDTARSPT